MSGDSIFTGIKFLNRGEVTAISSTVALLLARDLDEDDIATLGSLLTATADLLSTFSTLQRSGSDEDEEQEQNQEQNQDQNQGSEKKAAE